MYTECTWFYREGVLIHYKCMIETVTMYTHHVHLWRVYMENVHGECTWFKHDAHPWGGLVKIFKSVQVYMVSVHGECTWFKHHVHPW